MTTYSFLRLSSSVPDPGLPPGAANFREEFTASKGYEIVFDGFVLTVTHVTSGNAVDVPLSAVKYGVRARPTPAPEAPAPKKASRK